MGSVSLILAQAQGIYTTILCVSRVKPTESLMRNRIWVSEVAASLPNAKFDAVDISADQFPPESFRAPNVHFWTHNCVEPFPDEFLGKFDIVNARFWLCIVNDDVADKLLDNFLTLLSKCTSYELYVGG
jgi:chemotaxis methyl-accepting protein methylase